MSRLHADLAGGPNVCAFLDMIAFSEIGTAMLNASDEGYNVIVGSRPGKMILFDSYADHPRKLVDIRPGLKSTAAGRYQLLSRFFDPYKKLLRLTDFSPEAQDAIAIQQIRECRAIPLIQAGRFTDAVMKCKHIWASLPGAGYGQHENTLGRLETAYRMAGGKLAIA